MPETQYTVSPETERIHGKPQAPDSIERHGTYYRLVDAWVARDARRSSAVRRKAENAIEERGYDASEDHVVVRLEQGKNTRGYAVYKEYGAR